MQYSELKRRIVASRQRILDGKVNCIPMPFDRFRRVAVAGIQQGHYYGVTANSKVGKTQVTDAIFLYNTLDYAFANQDKLDVKIFYFSLEMSEEVKYLQLLSRILFVKSNGTVRVDPEVLSSVDRPLPEQVLDLLDGTEYQNYIKFFEEKVDIISSIRNPYGIYDIVRSYAKANGTQHTKIIDIVDSKTNEVIDQREVDDYYEPNNPDQYVIIIIDHAGLITPENGKSLYNSIAELSHKYCLALRDKYKYIPVLVQQQAPSQESNENLKLNKVRPTADGLGECKLTQQDFNTLLGIYSPNRHTGVSTVPYDVDLFQDNIRLLEVILRRGKGGGTTCPLLFDGATNYFAELPRPDDIGGMQEVKDMLERIRSGEIITNKSRLI